MGSKKVPEVRFNGFSGEWEGCKFGEISESFEYGLNASATSYDGRNKYIRITDIDESSNKFKQNDLTSPNTDLSQAEKYLLKKGDILFARTGASVGKTYCYDKRDGKVYYAGFLIRARLKQEYNVDFVFQTTLTTKYNNFVKITSQRSGQPGINAVEFASFTMMLPDKVEQDKIGNFFKQLDETIAFQQQELDTLKQTKQGFLQKMFPKEGESVPEIRFPGFNGECEKKRLKYLATFDKGIGYSKSDIVEEGDPIILYGRLYTKYQTVIEEVDTFTKIKEKSLISKGYEVIVPSSGETSEDIARASVVKRPGIILGGDLNVIYPCDDINSIFLALTISNGKQQKN